MSTIDLRRAVRSRFSSCLLGLFVLGACAPKQPPITPPPQSKRDTAPTTTLGAQGKLPKLPSGALPAKRWPHALTARIVEAEVNAGIETILLHVDWKELKEGTFFESVTLKEGSLYCFAAKSSAWRKSEASGELDEDTFAIWVRRPSTTPGTASAPLELILRTTPNYEEDEPQPGWILSVNVPSPSQLTAGSELFSRYLDALGDQSSESPLKWLLAPDKVEPQNFASSGYDEDAASTEMQVWREMMDLTTGYRSVEAAIVSRVKLASAFDRSKANIPVSQIAPPAVTAHPWKEMLPRRFARAQVEAWAKVVPADFYAVRAKSFDSFQTLLDEIEQVVEPTTHLLSAHRARFNLSERYRHELGIPQSQLTRLLGPSLIHQLVLIGSDPFLREGSDLTLLLSPKAAAPLLTALALARAQLQEHAPLKESRFTEQGIEVQVFESTSENVRQHVASFKQGEQHWIALSNSPGAIRRLLRSARGVDPVLADEADFQYMLARDPSVKEDILAYAGDRFILRNVSPQTRILDARRRFARVELLTFGYSELLFSMVYGRLPHDQKERISAPWLKGIAPRHAAGDPIAVATGQTPRSLWGTPARLTSLIDLPPVERVTETEKLVYESFRSAYDLSWSDRVDPIALRVRVAENELEANLRVLPLMNSAEYRDIAQVSGGQGSTRHPSLFGLAGILSIGRNSSLRKELGGSVLGFIGQESDLSWLGDFIEVGIADEPSLVEEVLLSTDTVMPPGTKLKHREHSWEHLTKLPLYVTVDLRSAATFALLLTALKKLSMEAAPGIISWDIQGEIQGATVVRVAAAEAEIFYALTKDRMHIATQTNVLSGLLRAAAEEKKNKPVAATKNQGGQLTFELAPSAARGPLALASAWLYEYTAWRMRDDRTAHFARLVLDGSPRARESDAAYQSEALKYLGLIPVTIDGKNYRYKEGELVDPDRGSEHEPIWPELPVSGGLIKSLFDALSRVRSEISIEQEAALPEESSLKARVLWIRRR